MDWRHNFWKLNQVWDQSAHVQNYFDSWFLVWNFSGIMATIIPVAMVVYLFIEMPIATLWSYVMVSLVGHTNRKRDEVEEKNEKNYKVSPEDNEMKKKEEESQKEDIKNQKSDL